jgi:AmiR/NasT family two-component response regulator
VDQGTYTSHLSALQGDPRDREACRAAISEATQLIMSEYGVGEISAYEILVHASVDSRTSVRETAVRILAGSQ